MAERESGWVIETAGGSYWDGSHTDRNGFVSDHNKALRFSRQQDAEKVLHWLLPRDIAFACRTAEHVWMGDEAARTDAGSKQPSKRYTNDEATILVFTVHEAPCKWFDDDGWNSSTYGNYVKAYNDYPECTCEPGRAALSALARPTESPGKEARR